MKDTQFTKARNYYEEVQGNITRDQAVDSLHYIVEVLETVMILGGLYFEDYDRNYLESRIRLLRNFIDKN